MPIDTDAYIPTQGNAAWRRRAGGAQGNNAVAAQHAERRAYAALPDSPVYLIVQNAFPCAICHEHFKGITTGNNKGIIIKITANEGNYSADHGLGQNASVPRVIYYFHGQAKMVSVSSRGAAATPPAGFPAHPDFEIY